MDPTILASIAHEMGATDARLHAICSAGSVERAQARLSEFKVEMKATYRRLALKYHPDQNKSPEAEAKFMALVIVHNKIEALQIAPPPPPVWRTVTTWSQDSGPPPAHVDFGAAVSSVNSGATTTTAYYDARRVAGMRG